MANELYLIKHIFFKLFKTHIYYQFKKNEFINTTQIINNRVVEARMKKI